MILLAAIVIIFVLVYFYWTSSFSHWKKLNVPHIPPHFLWGNLKDVVMQREGLFQVYEKIYRKFPDALYAGVYVFNRPGLVIRDPKLIKEVVVNSFSSFHDNDLSISEKADPIAAKNPFLTKGSEWKTRRAIHTTQFSSGKLKNMFYLFSQGGDRMIKFLNDEINKNDKCTIEAMELATKYTIYNVGNCSMGIDPKTFDEDNSEMARKIIEPNFYNGLKQFVLFALPTLSNILTVRLFPTEVTNKFRSMIEENLQYRKENSIVRKDFFEDIQEYRGEKCSVEDMMAQIGGLFLDGYVTTSTAINFILYELAIHPDIQQTLHDEIEGYLSKHNGEISYETFQEMQYLDAVVSEGLRKYPPFAIFTKVCIQRFTFPPLNDSSKPLTVEPNTRIIIPVNGLHHDEKYFPDPKRFDPTRFLNGNKENIEKFTYLPFNDGPRACLGKRFALLQMKMMLLKFLWKFEFRLNPKTVTPLKYSVQTILLAAEGGIWIDIYRREK